MKPLQGVIKKIKRILYRSISTNQQQQQQQHSLPSLPPISTSHQIQATNAFDINRNTTVPKSQNVNVDDEITPIFEEATDSIKQVKASLFSPETGIAATDLRQAINIDSNDDDDSGDSNKAIRNTFPNNLYIQPKAPDHLLSLNYNNKFDGGDGGWWNIKFKCSFSKKTK